MYLSPNSSIKFALLEKDFYQIITINQDQYYCLKDTKEEIIENYWAKTQKLKSTTQIKEFRKISHNNYTLK